MRGCRCERCRYAKRWGTEPRHREGMRVKLKRLVKRGWLVEASPGLFACASGVAGVLDGSRQAPKPEG
jgi:hypothetical protein